MKPFHCFPLLICACLCLSRCARGIPIWEPYNQEHATFTLFEPGSTWEYTDPDDPGITHRIEVLEHNDQFIEDNSRPLIRHWEGTQLVSLDGDSIVWNHTTEGQVSSFFWLYWDDPALAGIPDLAVSLFSNAETFTSNIERMERYSVNGFDFGNTFRVTVSPTAPDYFHPVEAVFATFAGPVRIAWSDGTVWEIKAYQVSPRDVPLEFGE